MARKKKIEELEKKFLELRIELEETSESTREPNDDDAWDAGEQDFDVTFYGAMICFKDYHCKYSKHDFEQLFCEV